MSRRNPRINATDVEVIPANGACKIAARRAVKFTRAKSRNCHAQLHSANTQRTYAWQNPSQLIGSADQRFNRDCQLDCSLTFAVGHGSKLTTSSDLLNRASRPTIPYHGCMAAAHDISTFIDVRLLEHPAHVVEFDPFPQPAGAECIFLGRTREERHPKHGPLLRLTYEAYHSMAKEMLNNLAIEIATQFSCLAVRIHHSVCEVPPGQVSVLIQIVCGHRDAAFDACRTAIDRLKREIPIWKREEWADGSTWSNGQPVMVENRP
jgi:molybdopterin synthase catalytic subunit